MIRTFKTTRPTIDPSAYVDLSAQVIGDVHIGGESSIWMNVVIRGDVNQIRIGKRTNIQDLTMIHVMRDAHPTIIGDEVTVGHSAVVHGTTIEDRVLVGMGALLLNGVHIESDCVIAAGTLLTEGTRIPTRSLVMGRPGKVKRQLTDEEVAEIRWYADNYVKYRLDYTTEVRASKPMGFK
ncbi:MAG TPA: gamma carbonic anhydrase family protein [Vicinamibacterales bacterium]|jgi:carbonic anhydrase/acetyltransferase-like protein (isoleucine patch superfamily)